MRAVRALPALALAALLAGCGSGAEIVRGDGATLAMAQSLPALGGRYRIAVGTIVDKTGALKEPSLSSQLPVLNATRPDVAQLTPAGLLASLQDMLITELFQVDRFIVVERAALNDVITEQEFAATSRVGDATRIPKAQLEGAELIVLGALTGFDAGIEGGAIPIPIPLGDRGDFGLAHLHFKRGFAALDLRVIDARTGRVLSTVTVRGKNRRLALDMDLFFSGPHHSIKLPGALSFFENTPIERALQEMTIAAVHHIVERVPAVPLAPIAEKPLAAPEPGPTPAAKPARKK